MIQDPVSEGIQRGWRVTDARDLKQPLELQTDVLIIGSGAGGGAAADVLTAAGLDVVMLEGGPLRSSQHHRLHEAQAYQDLYQENTTRTTADDSIRLLQGRAVGGSTGVSWTACFDPPAAKLAHWAGHFGIDWCVTPELEKWLSFIRRRHDIAPWRGRLNPNNRVLQDGCERLGWRWTRNERNVHNCWNLGYCALGCPTNASRSALQGGITKGLSRGMQLVVHAHAKRFSFHGDRVFELHCDAVHSNGDTAHQHPVRINALHYVLASGCIDSAALLLRSNAPNPYRTTGKRCYLLPSVLSVARFDKVMAPYHGAPQVSYTDQFLWGRDGGFLIQPLPLHPMFSSGVIPGHSEQHAALMNNLPRLTALASLLDDGFSEGGHVGLNEQGIPSLRYPLTQAHWESLRAAWQAMAEIQFAAGAREILPLHMDARPYGSYSAARRAIGQLPDSEGRARIGSAYLTGGCAMGTDPAYAVVDPDGRHHQVNNLSVMDGSVFPTPLGVPPMLAIQAFSARNAAKLAVSLGGDTV